jgi:release factor glutamine methyltransferase
VSLGAGGPGPARTETIETWRELHAETAARVPDVEARWLVEEVSGLDRSRWGETATAAGRARLAALVERRLAGEPLQYVLGRWSFRGLDLLIDRRVLIPRPETEVVAEVAIAEARELHLPPPTRASGAPYVIADMGTGSGALALALAAELTEAEVWATDRSAAALEVARANLTAVDPSAASRVHFEEGMWYEALPGGLRGRLRVIVSNPPYVTEAEFAGLPAEVRDHEPTAALVAGPIGRESLEELVAGGLDWLAPGGALVLELAPDQAAPLQVTAVAAGYEAVAIHRDLAGRDRVLVARRPLSRPAPDQAEEPGA